MKLPRKTQPPILTTLSYSAGVQSHCLLEMVLRGDVPKPKNFLVLNSDPGMEDPRTYDFVQRSRQRCGEAGIDFITADGPNLLNDILELKSSGRARLDNPPYWTKDPKTGKEGKLMQGCTIVYKIQPMRRALRRFLKERFPKSALRPGLVETWIGFASDEWHRCSDSDVKYVTLRYPLIELKMDRAMVEGYYIKHNIPKPPRSVCTACFSNGLGHYKEMAENRPDQFELACKVDDSVRDWTQIGVRQEVFVSKTLRPLRELKAINFGVDDDSIPEEAHCNSGVCFL